MCIDIQSFEDGASQTPSSATPAGEGSGGWAPAKIPGDLDKIIKSNPLIRHFIIAIHNILADIINREERFEIPGMQLPELTEESVDENGEPNLNDPAAMVNVVAIHRCAVVAFAALKMLTVVGGEGEDEDEDGLLPLPDNTPEDLGDPKNN